MKSTEEVAVEGMPFYESMALVRSKSGLEQDELLLFQLGFKAAPESCPCGHGWNVFDVMLEGVQSGHHAWSLFRNPARTIPTSFRKSEFALTCPRCGERSTEIVAHYNYGKYCACPPPPPPSAIETTTEAMVK